MKVAFFTAAISLGMSAIASDAVFSADGKSVYMASYGAQSIFMSNDASPVPGAISLSIEFPGAGKDACVHGVSRMKDGDVCLDCGNALWLWRPGSKTASLLQKMPDGESIDSFACNPLTDEIILTSGRKLFWKESRSRKMLEAGIRYPPGGALDAVAFLPDGSFLFAADGDLWHGVIERDSTDDDIRVNLVAYRYAPLAKRETYDGTPTETGVIQIAPAKHKIFVRYCRMNGSGWGSLLRLNLPPQSPNGDFAVRNSIADSIGALRSVEKVYVEDGSLAYLCASPDGETVFYAARPDKDGSLLPGFMNEDSQLKMKQVDKTHSPSATE